MGKKYLTPLQAALKYSKALEGVKDKDCFVDNIMHELARYIMYELTRPCNIKCSDSEEISIDDIKIYGAEIFDSLQSYDLLEVYQDYDVKKVFNSSTSKSCVTTFIIYSMLHEDELQMYGTFLWSSDISINYCKVGLFKTIPNIPERIRKAFHHYPHNNIEVSSDLISKVKKQMDEWKEIGYLDSDYRADFKKPTAFCRAIKEFLDTIEAKRMTFNPFKEFSQVLFDIPHPEEIKWNSVKTAWHAAYNPESKY